MAIAKLVKLTEVDILKKYYKEEIILNEGDFTKEMYLILSGDVEVYKTVKGNQFLIEKLGDGDIFGEIALLEEVPSNITVKAVEDTTVVAINKANFEKVICQNVSLIHIFMRRLSRRLQKKDEAFIKLVSTKENNTYKEPLPKKVEKIKVKAQKPETVNRVQTAKLVLPEQKIYSTDAGAPNHDNYLYDKKLSCPICQKVFHTKAIRNSRLSLLKTELDLRQRFANFEPLWYKIWVCPHCLYANFDAEFNKLSAKEKIYVNEYTRQLKEKTRFEFSDPRRIEEVIKAYYLALNCTQDVFKQGRIWLCLSWLYQDVSDEEMFNKASKQALKYYQEAYYNANQDNSPDKDQRLCYVLGELYLRANQLEEARKFYFNSIMHRGGSSIINRQAQIRIDELKKRK